MKLKKYTLLTMVLSSTFVFADYVVPVNKEENNYVFAGNITWVDSGLPYNCQSWSTDETLINYNVPFTKTRSCSQNQTGTQSTSEGNIIKNQVITITESESGVGTRDYVIGTTESSWSSWSSYNVNVDLPNLYNCGAWVQYHEDAGAVYQRSLCTFNQTRTRDTYEDWASGAQTSTGIETQTNPVNQYKYKTLMKAMPH